MPEIANAFGGPKHSREGSHRSLEAFDCSLGSFAQPLLERMEHQLYGVELRRILRQVTQLRAAGSDRVPHTSDFMEGDIVDDHDVPPSEHGSQTLLDVGEKRFSIHGSLDHHGSHDAGLTEARNEGQRFPVSHRDIADQAFSAQAPAVATDHVGRNGSFVDKYEVSGIKQALLPDPAPARPSHVGSLALCRLQAFF